MTWEQFPIFNITNSVININIFWCITLCTFTDKYIEVQLPIRRYLYYICQGAFGWRNLNSTWLLQQRFTGSYDIYYRECVQFVVWTSSIKILSVFLVSHLGLMSSDHSFLVVRRLKAATGAVWFLIHTTIITVNCIWVFFLTFRRTICIFF